MWSYGIFFSIDLINSLEYPDKQCNKEHTLGQAALNLNPASAVTSFVNLGKYLRLSFHMYKIKLLTFILLDCCNMIMNVKGPSTEYALIS